MGIQLVKPHEKVEPKPGEAKGSASAERPRGSLGSSRRKTPAGRGAHAASIAASAIPDKLYFKIGEVAKLCAVQTYVLRFWESEFPQLRPAKGGTGQRLYRKRDVEMALHIRRLLYDEGFTIPGARQSFQQDGRRVPGGWGSGGEKQTELPLEPGADSPMQVKKLKAELRAILGMLSTPVGAARAASRGKPDAGPSLFHP